MKIIADKLKADPSLVSVKNAPDLAGRAPRPKDVSFDNTKARTQLRTQFLDYDETIERMF